MLSAEIKLLQKTTKVIVALGNIAFDAYCNISNIKGLEFGHNRIYHLQGTVKEALNTEDQRMKLGFSTPFEFAVYEELGSVEKDRQLFKTVTGKIFEKVNAEAKLIGWKTKRSSEKKMSIDIYDILVENKYPDQKIEDVTQMIIDLAKRHL